MKLEAQDWQKLKIPLIILGAVVAVILLLISGAYYYSTSQQEALQKQQNLLSSARQRYQSSGAEKDTITQYLPQYQALIAKGFVGEERRIEWVEQLRAEHKSLKLFGIQYAISQQEDYKPTYLGGTGAFVMHRSVMKLDLDMLHEGDILRLTESLATKGGTPFILRDCLITRVNASIAISNTPNLHAQCLLDWLTMREPASTVTTP